MEDFKVGDLIRSRSNDKIGVIQEVYPKTRTYRIFWIKEKYYNHYYSNFIKEKIVNNKITKVLYL